MKLCQLATARLRAAARFCVLPVLAALFLLQSSGAWAGSGPFGEGWVLDTAASSLTFQSIKNGAKIETSSFTSYQGAIDEDGTATVRIQLDSVDTKVDLRNVRMRFLLFETFEFPEATITARIDPATIADLATLRRVHMPLNYQIELHGLALALETQVVVTLISDNSVSVASVSPLALDTASFGLDEGVRKLEEAAKVTIVPSGLVSFDFVFDRKGGKVAEPVAVAAPASTAVETAGTFSEEECAGRFEILSQTGAIYFRTGSAELSPESRPLLQTVIDIVERCPSINVLVAGHTDAAGDEIANQQLSEARASSVRSYLTESGVPADRVRSVGYGETRPVAPNDTERDRRRNRRIEFAIAPS